LGYVVWKEQETSKMLVTESLCWRYR